MIRVAGRLAYAAATYALREHEVFHELQNAREARQLDLPTLQQRQAERLSRILDWGRRHTAHYSSIPRCDASSALQVLQTLPFLEKRTLQEGAERLMADYKGRMIQKSTGGSTGAPVRIRKNADGIAKEMAQSWAALESYGIRIGDPSARFWGTPLTWRRRLRFRMADLAMNRIRFSAFDIDDADFRTYWRRSLRFGPRWLYGYASLIHLFADWIERHGLDGSRIPLIAIVPTSEPLNETQREQISRVFKAPVYDEYGCGEVGAIAYGCAAGQLHVLTENLMVECLDEEARPVQPGESGEIVVTDLTNYAMPLIRYRLGDRAEVADSCDCGSELPVLRRVHGRIHDVVFTPAGRRWHGEKINYLMSHLYGEVGGFRQYQVVQYSSDTLKVCLVTDSDISPELSRRIESYIAEQLDGMRAEVLRVDQIERAASGKIRVIRNDWLSASQPH